MHDEDSEYTRQNKLDNARLDAQYDSLLKQQIEPLTL